MRREITAILLFKLAILVLAGFTIFGGRHRLHVNAEIMENRLLSVPNPSAHENLR